MKELDVVFPVARKGIREELTPVLFKTTSHCVVFPDGESLDDKWNNINIPQESQQQTTNNGITVSTIMAYSHGWNLISFNDSMFELTSKIELSARYVVPSMLGTSSHDNTGIYLMSIGLPTLNTNNQKEFDLSNSLVFITETKDSGFEDEFTLHNIYASIMNNELQIEIHRHLPLDYIFLNQDSTSLDVNISEGTSNKLITFKANILIKGTYK